MPGACDGPDPTARWRAVSDLVWTHYDDSDDWVVYIPASSDIHLLTASANELWTLVSTHPASSSDELAVSLAKQLGRPLDAELRSVTDDALTSLDRAGLIRPAGL